MPKLSLTPRLGRRGAALALGAATAIAGGAALPAPALANHKQLSIIEDYGDLPDPQGTLQQFRELGANTVRVVLNWNTVAPSSKAKKKPKGFNAANPNDRHYNWGAYDGVVSWAKRYGLKVDLTVAGGAPRWAEHAAAPKANGVNLQTVAWKPKNHDYQQFVKAVARRYSSVHLWAIFNEPNFGQDLGPQAIHGSRTPLAPKMYRGLVNAGWRALHSVNGHKHDTIMIGELAAEGSEPHKPASWAPQGLPGNYGQTRPLLFIRDLYCVNDGFRKLRGGAARGLGCPTNGAGSRKFRKHNPGLFKASGFADHPYDGGKSPTSRSGLKVDFATFPVIRNLESTLDRVNRAYGSHKRLAIYNTEYGEITRPPKGRGYPSPARAAQYINQAEYISFKSGRIASYMQYLLKDPPANEGVYSGFASGLEFGSGKHKATYAAFQMPVWMPHTRFSHRHREEIWGAARPASFMKRDGNGRQVVDIQVDGKTVKAQQIHGTYFDDHIKFPKGKHKVRLAYRFPAHDSFLPVSELGKTIHSRTFTIHVK